jgi:hypothetical protein
MRSASIRLSAILVGILICNHAVMAMGKRPTNPIVSANGDGELAVTLNYGNAYVPGASLQALISGTQITNGNVQETAAGITGELNLGQSFVDQSGQTQANWFINTLAPSPNWSVSVFITNGPLNGATVTCPVNIGAAPPPTQLTITINGTPGNATITPSNCQISFQNVNFPH